MSAHIVYSKKASNVLTTFDKRRELNLHRIDSKCNAIACYIFCFVTSSWQTTTFLIISISGLKKSGEIKGV